MANSVSFKVRYFFLFFLFLQCVFSLRAQENRSLSGDYDFVRYLIGNQMKTEALTWARQNFDTASYCRQSLDSLHFLRAWAFYSGRELSKAVEYFDKVDDFSSLSSASRFFSSLSSAYLKDYDKAVSVLKTNKQSLSDYGELYDFELAGLALLKGDYDLYKEHGSHFTYTSYNLAQRERILDSAFYSLSAYKSKSPWLAASLSALIPGLGKIYAGHIGEGVGAFLTVGSFAALTAENWHRDGLGNWKTIVFGCLGTLFYIGNIYGSAISVKLSYDQYHESQQISILYNIHLPLRNTFGL